MSAPTPGPWHYAYEGIKARNTDSEADNPEGMGQR